MGPGCSADSCDFDVLMTGDELSIFLLHHLGQSSQISGSSCSRRILLWNMESVINFFSLLVTYNSYCYKYLRIILGIYSLLLYNFRHLYSKLRGFSGGSVVKNLPSMQETLP